MIVPPDAATGFLAMARYHHSMLELAKGALDQVPDSQREFDALTVSISTDTFELIRERIKALCTEILRLESQSQSRDCVAQLNLNFFTLTKWNEEKP